LYSRNLIHVVQPVNINIKFRIYLLLYYSIGVTTSQGTTLKVMNFNFFH